MTKWRTLRTRKKGAVLPATINSTTVDQPRPPLSRLWIFWGTPVLYLAAYEVVTDIEIGQCLVQPHVLHQVCRLDSGSSYTRVQWALQRLVSMFFIKFIAWRVAAITRVFNGQLQRFCVGLVSRHRLDNGFYRQTA